MERRVWIKQIAFVGAGLLILPACRNGKGAISVSLKRITLSDDEEALIALVAETIIPETGTSGARTLNLHQFLLKMMDDCYSPENQDKFLKGLRELNGFAQKEMSQDFPALNSDKQLILLTHIRDQKPAENLTYFLQETRQLVIKGYDHSEYFMTKIIPFEQVPDRFHGSVKVYPEF